jgi:hypothetical protein
MKFFAARCKAGTVIWDRTSVAQIYLLVLVVELE